MARTIVRCIITTTPIGFAPRWCATSRRAEPTSCHGRWDARRTGSPRGPNPRRRSARAGADGAGCGSRPGPRPARWRRPHAADQPVRRRGTSTTAPLRSTGVRASEAVRSRHGVAAGRSGRQPVAALEPPVLQHGAPCSGAHAMAEPVLLGPPAIVGLKRALHPFLLISTSSRRSNRACTQARRQRERPYRPFKARGPGPRAATGTAPTHRSPHAGGRLGAVLASRCYGALSCWGTRRRDLQRSVHSLWTDLWTNLG
jgi:hypothetical protein